MRNLKKIFAADFVSVPKGFSEIDQIKIDHLPKHIISICEEFFSIFRTRQVLLLKSASTIENYFLTPNITQIIKLRGDGVSAFFSGSLPKVVRDIGNPKIEEVIFSAIALKQEIAGIESEQERFLYAHKALDDDLKNSADLLDRYLTHNCTEFIVRNEKPHEYLTVVKECADEIATYTVSFDSGKGEEKINLNAETGEQLLQLQLSLAEKKNTMAKQKSFSRVISSKISELENKMQPKISMMGLYFKNNPIHECEIFGVAIDPKDNSPCILVISKVEEETNEVPSGTLRTLILKHLTGEAVLSHQAQISLGVIEDIEEIERIFSKL